MTDLLLHRGEVSLDFGHPTLDLTMRDLAVEDQWIIGNIEVKASAFGKSLDQTVPFKTLNNADTDLDIGLGAHLTLKAELESPKRVCASGDLHWGPISASSGRQCVDVA